jgi:hypothetical protein
VWVESVLQGIRDKKPENVKGHVNLLNLVVGRVEGKLLKGFLVGPETLHNRGEIIQEVLLAIEDETQIAFSARNLGFPHEVLNSCQLLREVCLKVFILLKFL